MMWLAVLLITVTLGLLAYLDTRKPKKFPPGPTWYPLIGCAPQVKRARLKTGSLYGATAELSRKYGPVLGLKIGKDPLVIVYDPPAFKEFSLSEDLIGRPKGEFFEMRTWKKRRGILLTDEGFWQEQKKFLVRELREFGFGTRNMSLLIEEEMVHFLDFVNKALVTGNGAATFNMESVFNVSVLNTIWKMLAGVRYSPDDREMTELLDILGKLFQTVHMVGAAFSHFPILKYVAPDMSGYKCYVDTHQQIWDFLQREVDRHMKSHNPEDPRDLMDVYLNALKSADRGDSFSEDQLKAICLDIFMAGSETTNNTLSFGFMYLILNPRVQKKAQEEIDRVLGKKMPSLDDRPRLPYMEAITLEALRMFAARAFTVPHRSLRDTFLCGYFIPKDVLVIGNMHGIMMSEVSGFKNLEAFEPERFLKDGKVSVPEGFAPFGLGKRRCMGEGLARANVFLFTTLCLQHFDFHVVPEQPPDMKIVDGVTPSPMHYKAIVKPRQKVE